MARTLRQFVLMSLVQFHSYSMTRAQQCKPVRHYKEGYALLSSAYKTTTAEHFESCYTDCILDERCKSCNYFNNGTCELNNVTKTGYPSRFIPQEKSIYADARDPDYGSSPGLAVSSCKYLLRINVTEVTSGIYWIKLGKGSTQTPPFQVYCDMTTDGGGWTLVYSYQILNSTTGFVTPSNAIDPIPSWPLDHSVGNWSAISTTVPLSETSYSAMNFTLWKEIGTEFLVKPNILHWFSCKPGNGDLVNWKEGSINCRNVKNIATDCLSYKPTEFKLHPCGPLLIRSSVFLHFDGRTNQCWPVHDPCGKTTTAVSKHIPSNSPPGGALYIR